MVILCSHHVHIIRLYDLNNYKARMSYREHLDSVSSINWVPMSNILWLEVRIKLYLYGIWEVIYVLRLIMDIIILLICCAVELAGNVLASCDAVGIVRI